MRFVAGSSALAALSIAFVAGCSGISDALPGDDEVATPDPPPAAEILNGEDHGVAFEYRGGTVTVDISKLPGRLRRQVIAEEIVVDCGGADQSRRWPRRAGSDLTIRLTREGGRPRDLPTDVRSCRLEPVPGKPIAFARMRPADR